MEQGIDSRLNELLKEVEVAKIEDSLTESGSDNSQV